MTHPRRRQLTGRFACCRVFTALSARFRRSAATHERTSARPLPGEPLQTILQTVAQRDKAAAPIRQPLDVVKIPWPLEACRPQAPRADRRGSSDTLLPLIAPDGPHAAPAAHGPPPATPASCRNDGIPNLGVVRSAAATCDVPHVRSSRRVGGASASSRQAPNSACRWRFLADGHDSPSPGRLRPRVRGDVAGIVDRRHHRAENRHAIRETSVMLLSPARSTQPVSGRP